MLQIAGAVLLAVHGLIHLIGFVVPWRLAVIDGFPYRTTALNGLLAVGDAGSRAVGIAWLGLAVGFVVAAIGVSRGEAWAGPMVAALCVASIVLCVLGLPDAAFGILVNVAILAVLGYLAIGGPVPALPSR